MKRKTHSVPHLILLLILVLLLPILARGAAIIPTAGPILPISDAVPEPTIVERGPNHRV